MLENWMVRSSTRDGSGIEEDVGGVAEVVAGMLLVERSFTLAVVDADVVGEEVLRFGDLACQSISGIALALPGEGSRTVTGAVVRHFNVTPPPDATANATFYLTLAADNPNRRVSILYEWVEFRVLYGEAAQLAIEDAPAFAQPHRNVTRLGVRAVARSVPVGEQTARELRHDLAAGQVGVDVRMRARVQFKVAGVRSRRYDLQALCSPVVIGLAPSSARSFQSVPCDVAIS